MAIIRGQYNRPKAAVRRRQSHPITTKLQSTKVGVLTTRSQRSVHQTSVLICKEATTLPACPSGRAVREAGLDRLDAETVGSSSA
jgi:hypothetical protein